MSSGRYQSGSTCPSCDPSCQTCSGQGPSSCTSCDASSNRSLSGSQCTKSCPLSNQYVDSQNTCQDCPEFCRECADITGKCSSCSSTYTLFPSENLCHKIEKPLEVKTTYYYALTQTLVVSFNQPIIVSTDLHTNLNIELRDPLAPAKTTKVSPRHISLDDSNSRIQIQFDFDLQDESFEDYQIVIAGLSQGVIQAERDNKDILTNYPIIQDEITHIKSPLTDTSVVAAQGTSITLRIISLLLVFVSISIAIITIKLFQILFFLLFINVNLPSNATRFIYSFKKNILDYFPIFLIIRANKKRTESLTTRRLIQATTSEAGQRSDDLFSRFCIPHRKFEENDQTCSVFINVGSFITQLVVFLIVKFIVYSIKKILVRKAVSNICKKSEEIEENHQKGRENIQIKRERDTELKRDKQAPDSREESKPKRGTFRILGSSSLNKLGEAIESTISVTARSQRRLNFGDFGRNRGGLAFLDNKKIDKESKNREKRDPELSPGKFIRKKSNQKRMNPRAQSNLEVFLKSRIKHKKESQRQDVAQMSKGPRMISLKQQKIRRKKIANSCQDEQQQADDKSL